MLKRKKFRGDISAVVVMMMAAAAVMRAFIFKLVILAGLLWEQGSKPRASTSGTNGEEDNCWLNPRNNVKTSHISSEYIQCLDHLPKLSQFVRTYLQAQLIAAANHLHRVSITIMLHQNAIIVNSSSD